MNRAEWYKKQHEIRASARSFRKLHGGHPNFADYFIHDGIEWIIIRRLDRTWSTHIRPTRIDEQTVNRPMAAIMTEAQGYRADIRRAPWMAEQRKRAIRLALKDIAAYRTN